jgi:CHRD domain-containing protein
MVGFAAGLLIVSLAANTSSPAFSQQQQPREKQFVAKLSGSAYANVHTQKHQNGEIRGQIGPMK